MIIKKQDLKQDYVTYWSAASLATGSTYRIIEFSVISQDSLYSI